MSIENFVNQRRERTMSFREFAEYSHERQEELIRNWLDMAGSLDGLLKKGHSHELHIGMKDEELVERALSEFKPVSTFINEDAAFDAANEIIYYCAPEIARWLTTPRSFNDNYRTFVATLDIGDVNGYGVDLNFNKIETDRCTIVLERDRSEGYDGKFFFYVKTLYPAIDKENDMVVGDMSKTAQDLLTSDIATDDITKTYWALRMSGHYVKQEMHPHFGQCLFVNDMVGNEKFSVMINKDSFTSRRPFIRVKEPDGRWVSVYNNPRLSDDVRSAIEQKAQRVVKIHDYVVTKNKEELNKIFANASRGQRENSKTIENRDDIDPRS